jgi:hypothetical protein
MSEKSFPFYDGQGETVTEADWEAMASAWQDSGVYGHPGDDSLTIVPGATQMKIQVNPGDAAINGYHYSLTAAKELDCVANAGGTARADLVVLKLDRVNSLITPVLLTNTAVVDIPADCIPLGVWSQLPSSLVTSTNWGSATDRRWFMGARMRPGIAGADPPASPGGFLYRPDTGGKGAVYVGALDAEGDPVWVEWKPWARDIALDGPVKAFDGTSVTTASTTYTSLSPAVSLTFTAPPSGQVYITVNAKAECASPSVAYCSFEVRNNNVSGSVVQAANDDKAAAVQDQFWAGSEYRDLVTSLTPGNTYFVRALARSSNSASTASFFSRQILVEPVLIDGPADEVGTGGVELDGGSIIAVPEGDTSTEALRFNIPSGDRSSAPDTLGFYWNTGTAGSPVNQRAAYFNEYGEFRAMPSRNDRVPVRIKGLTGQTASLTEWTDISNVVQSWIDGSGGGHFASLKVNEIPVAGDYEFTPADYGLKAWVGDPGKLAGGIQVPGGIVRLLKVKIPKAITIANVVVYIKGASMALTSGQNFVALYDTSGNRVGVSADMTSAFMAATAGATVTCALTSAYSAPAGFVYAAVLFNGSNTPNMGRFQNAPEYSNVNLTVPRFGMFGSGLTSMPANITPGSIVSDATGGFWAGLS